VGFCVSGEGRLFRAAVLHAEKIGIRASLVVAEYKASPELEGFCSEHQVPFVRIGKMPRPEFDKTLVHHCTKLELDLLSLTFDKIIPQELIKHFAGRVINVHPALLPAFAGLDGLGQSERAGVRYMGATIHLADELMDHGAIVAQCVLGLRRGDTVASAGRRLFPYLRLMYLQVLAWFAEGRVEFDEQGRVWIRDAVYGETPISPAVERAFAD
jgi:phosphoribosylglycinamide formyltransferase-1